MSPSRRRKHLLSHPALLWMGSATILIALTMGMTVLALYFSRYRG